MKRKQITMLPSMVVYPNGEVRELNSLNAEERAEFNRRMAEKIGNVLSDLASRDSAVLRFCEENAINM